MARTKWKKIIVAGPLIVEAVYPAIPGREQPSVRAAKRKLSSEAQQRMNQKYSWQKLELMLAANFLPGDLVVTLTYDDEHLPPRRSAAEAKLKYFRQKLSAKRRTHGKELVMFWNTESKHGDGRFHHHAVINTTGDDYNDILSAWGQGEIEISPLKIDKEHSYATLAKYMCKESRERVGQRVWSYTRNAKKFTVETFRVEADTPLNIPHGAVALEEASSRSEYGSFKYIKYYYQGSLSRRRAKRRRARK